MGFLERARLALRVLASTSVEIGRPGTRHWAGKIITGEWVPELTGPRGLDTYERMRSSDGAVAATLRSLKLPLRAATWDIEPASSDPQDVEIADRVRANLFEGMSMTWEDHLRQLLTHFEFGFYVCEKRWQISDDMPTTWPALEFRRARGEIPAFGVDADDPQQLRFTRDDGTAVRVDRRTFYAAIGRFGREPLVTLRKLAPRQQKTVDKWDVAPDGGLRGVVQKITGGQDAGRYEIPIEQLLIFVNDKEAANWTGKSVLRPAYKHWFMKDLYYRTDAIAAERFGVGIPIMKVPKDKAQDRETLEHVEEILENVRSHERAQIVEVEGYEFRVDGMGQGRGKDNLPMIQHHDWMIAVSVLAQHLMLGSTDTGSHALAGDITSLFLMVEEAHGREICSVHNRYLIPQMVRFNYPGVTRFPQLTVGRIETRDTGKLIAAVGNAVQAGALSREPELENYLRDSLGLPALASSGSPAADDIELLKKRADAVGILIRSGFDPADATAAAGLPAMKHSGLQPVTVKEPEPSTEPLEVPAHA